LPHLPSKRRGFIRYERSATPPLSSQKEKKRTEEKEIKKERKRGFTLSHNETAYRNSRKASSI